ncbi:MAG: tyrosine--tRNA ligase [Methanobacteriota archaeon]|nr:MAG: tyrosine--tRNA ligase [Euryarchaeota archaeon]
MSLEAKVDLVRRHAVELVTEDELRALLSREPRLKAYVGFEPSGMMQIGQGFVIAAKIKDLVEAGFDVTVLLADWHAFINDKFGGDLARIQACGRYFEDCFRALGVPDTVRFVTATELVASEDYWMNVLRASKAASVARIKRALTIMGRKEEEADLDASKLIYPAMQVADIHAMDLDLALGGLDQRHAHMLYRDVAPKLKWKMVVALHTPLVGGLQGGGRMDPVESKMSKSKPDNAILIPEAAGDVDRKIAKAFCPANEVEGNPILEIARHILLPMSGVLKIERDAKYGGDVAIATYEDLGRLYAKGDLHPKDLKDAVARSLNAALEPVRTYFHAHPEHYRAVFGGK